MHGNSYLNLIVFLVPPEPGPNRRRARRGRPSVVSTVAGRILEQDAQGEQVRKREIHERRLRILAKEEEIGNILLESARAKERMAKDQEQAFRRKLALEISSASFLEKKSQWEELLAKKKYELFLQTNPRLNQE